MNRFTYHIKLTALNIETYVKLSRIKLEKIPISRCKKAIFLFIITTARNRFPEREIEFIVDASKHIFNKILRCDDFELNKNFEYHNRNVIERILSRLHQDDSFAGLTDIYWRYLKYFHRNVLTSEYFTAPYKDFILEEIPLINNEQCKLIKKGINKTYKLMRKLHSSYLKYYYRDKIKGKIDLKISFSDISLLFGIFSILFVSTGFLYNHFLISPLGLRLSDFFELTDYLKTSADKIIYAASSLFIGVAIGTFTSKATPTGHITNKQKNKFKIYISILILLGILSAIYSLYHGSRDGFDLSIWWLIIFLSPVVAILISFYFKEHAKVGSFIYCSSIIIAMIYHSAASERNNFLEGRIESAKNYEIVYSQDAKLSNNSTGLIVSCSNYHIIYDFEKKHAIAIPTSFILSLSPTSKKDTFFDILMNAKNKIMKITHSTNSTE